MNNETIQNINKLSKSGYDTIKNLYEINVKIAEQISEQQMAFANLAMECATAQIAITGKSTSYKDVLSEQTNLLNEVNERIQGIARNTIDIMNESKDEVSAWVEKGVKDASSITPFAKKSV